jgi:hypothetical protein
MKTCRFQKTGELPNGVPVYACAECSAVVCTREDIDKLILTCSGIKESQAGSTASTITVPSQISAIDRPTINNPSAIIAQPPITRKAAELHGIISGLSSMAVSRGLQVVRSLKDCTKLVDDHCMDCPDRETCGCKHLGGCSGRERYWKMLLGGGGCPAKRFPGV